MFHPPESASIGARLDPIVLPLVQLLLLSLLTLFPRVHPILIGTPSAFKARPFLLIINIKISSLASIEK